MDDLAAVLTAAGSSSAEVVETACHLTDMGREDEFNGIYSQ
jgi:enamine deaminase RidA (YjgF/YER057c/UK114 family)